MLREALDFIDAGGFVMAPLAVMTVVLWYALGWRMVTLGRANVGRFLSGPADPSRSFDVERECRRASVLVKTIVLVAPLLGLLGTVSGMIETFDALGDMSLFSQSGGIAGGISQALITTQMGLAVAIPGLVVGRLLDRRADAVIDKLEGRP